MVCWQHEVSYMFFGGIWCKPFPFQHPDRWKRYALASRSTIAGLWEEKYIFVSSAYIMTSEVPGIEAISFIKMINNSGPIMEPWGTHCFIFISLENAPLFFTSWKRSDKQLLRRSRAMHRTPYLDNLFSNKSSCIESKAFLRSRNRPSVYSLFPIFSMILSLIFTRACSIDLYFRKP